MARRHGVNPRTIAKWRGRSVVADLPAGPASPHSTTLPAEEEATVRTAQGTLRLFVAIDRTSKFAFIELHERATRRIAGDLPRHLVAAVPHRSHAVLSDNGLHFTTPGNTASAAPLIKAAMARREVFRAHSSELACARNDVERRLAKPYHPWASGQVERMSRTLKEATVHRRHHEGHKEPRIHRSTFVAARNHARRLRTLEGLTPCEFIRRFICRASGGEGRRPIRDPHHDIPGPDI